MTRVYEFHVAGSIGQMVQSALPELTEVVRPRNTILTGAVDDPEQVAELLRRLDAAGLITTQILIARQGRRQDQSDPVPAATK